MMLLCGCAPFQPVARLPMSSSTVMPPGRPSPSLSSSLIRTDIDTLADWRTKHAQATYRDTHEEDRTEQQPGAGGMDL